MDQRLSDPDTTDLSALSWVHGELKRSLDAAHKALRRYLKELEASGGSDVDAVDPSVLRQARASLHQGVGALELVGMPAGAQLLRAAEAAVARFATRGRKLNLAAVEAVEQGSFALLDYLSRLLAGKPVSAVALFPAYRGLQELAGADRIHPADLWETDWQWMELPAEGAGRARLPDERAIGAFEALLLALMRGQPGTPIKVSAMCAELAEGARGRLATMWQLAAAFFEGVAAGFIPSDNYAKRVASRLLAQLRLAARGEEEVSERLAQDLLFFCDQAGARADEGRTPRLAAVRDRFGLQQPAPADYEEPRLGRFDPALLTQARKRVAGAQDAWSAVSGGELHRLGSLPEQFSLVGDSLRRLMPGGTRLADALQQTVQHAAAAGESPVPELAMEVATALLYLDAVLEDGDLDQPEQALRSERLADRLDDARQGATVPPLEPWMEELYRRVSDRQTMGSVVQELRGALAETEKLIDQFFRQPTDSSVLIPVPAQLSAMRGVFSVLGLDQASQAVLRMRDDVDGLASTQVEPERALQAGTFDRLAGNLGALGFLVDMLSVQPQMAKSLFHFDADAGLLASTVGGGTSRLSPVNTGVAPLDEPRLIDHARDLAAAVAQPEVPLDQLSDDLARLTEEAIAADETGVAEAARDARDALEQALAAPDGGPQVQTVREQLQQALGDLVEAAVPAPVALPAPQPLPEGDGEMREIFLEEAREVLDNAAAARAALVQAPDDLGELTALRRAFHTLKGSSRMVGLAEFGEAAWAGEQLYNARLAEAPRADEALLAVTDEVLAYLADWIAAIADGHDGGHQAPPVRTVCDALRLDGRPLPLGRPAAAPRDAAPALAEAVLADAEPAAAVEPLPDFALDLATLDAAAEPPPAARRGRAGEPAPARAGARRRRPRRARRGGGADRAGRARRVGCGGHRRGA
ncbi:Hpt domain-containing protein [Aquabacterium sp. J223]|uniref:Hpt domain-containing protein n=1 Tax=Aquabacterium sp. J223 TaxID=2898431 RepID=UPI0021ADF2BE|nr:Hpt domain-containing protein [Aquabacterium sp. J223]